MVNELDRVVILSIEAFDEVTRPYPVNFFLTNGTAIQPDDFEYLQSTTTFEFDVNITAFQVNISISLDNLLEDTEEFFGHLSSDYFAVLFQNNFTTIRIIDGDCK